MKPTLKMDETAPSKETMLAMNEALTLGALHQHELAEVADKLNAKLRVEISVRTRMAALLTSHQKVLEMLASGALLEPMLDFLARSMEDLSEGKFLVAIHLMEGDGHHFGYVAAPNLPVSYALATRGMDARLQMGPCSAAVVAGAPTVVHDFVEEKRWPEFTAEIVSLGVRGCFTTPITSSTQRILGTFAIYYRQPCDPSPSDHEIVEVVTRTAAIAIERKHADEGLRRALEFDEAVMTNMGEGLYTVDAQGLVTSMNPAAEIIFGYTFEELRGRRMHDITHHHHPDGRPFPAEECAGLQVLKQGNALIAHEDYFIRKDGTFFDVVYSSAPLRSASGITGVVVVFRDVTEHKRADAKLRESQERYRVLFGALPVAAFVCDREARIQYYNPRATELWQREPKAGVDRYCGSMKLYLPDGTLLPHALSPIMEVMRTGIPARNVEVSIERPDGSRIPVIVNFAALKNAQGEIVGAVTSFDDISDRKRAEEAVQTARDELEQRVIERTTDLTVINSELERAMTQREKLERELLEISDREKRRIGEDLHDVICQDLAATALLLKSHARKMAMENLTASGALEEAAETVNRNVSVARELARGLQALDPSASGLKNSLKALAAKASKSSGITCRFKLGRGVRMSEDTVALHFYRIAQEAVNNAIKHSKASNVLITLDRNPTHTCISIQDDGRGIGLGRRSKGLGLHMMRYRANTMGGELKVGSRPTGGMEITCTIPTKDHQTRGKPSNCLRK